MTDEVTSVDNKTEEKAYQPTDDYTFIQEKIKERPINKKKLIKQSVTTGGLAILFGLVACATFMFLEPVMSKLMTSEETEIEPVVLPEEQEEMLPENMVKDDKELKDGFSETEQEEIQSNIANAIATYQIEISDYQLLYEKLYSLVGEVNKSMVTVSEITNETNLMMDSYSTSTDATGIIVADNNVDLIIISTLSSLEIGDTATITFFDSNAVKGDVIAKDKEMGMVAISVPLIKIPYDTKQNMVYAELGNSNLVNLNGSIVMAIGNPMGYKNSVGYGIVTSVSTEVNATDVNYRLITTDIYGSRTADGVIVNSKGKIVAVINQSYNNKDMPNMISGIGITELRELIENLSNGINNTHLGLYTTDVSATAKSNGIPEGAYITSVCIDTSAMINGLRKGDVVISVNNTDIHNSDEYEESVRECKPGEEVKLVVMRQNTDGYSEIEVTVTAY